MLREYLVFAIFSLFAAQSAGAVEYHWLHLCNEVTPSPNECPGYDTKQSDSEAPAMPEFWEIWSTSSLPSLLGSYWPGVVAPVRILPMGQVEQFDI